jgi:5-methylcytosine-specific restriction protein B
MARYCQDRDTGPILEAAREWATRCLVENGSILGTGSLWTSENFAQLDRFFVQQPDAGEGDFYEKLEGQMSGAPPDAPKLMAELLWVLFLFPSNTGPRAKRAGIAQAWSYSGETLDGDLRLLSDAVLRGIGSS